MTYGISLVGTNLEDTCASSRRSPLAVLFFLSAKGLGTEHFQIPEDEGYFVSLLGSSYNVYQERLPEGTQKEHCETEKDTEKKVRYSKFFFVVTSS
jgi:hypothetical protein